MARTCALLFLAVLTAMSGLAQAGPSLSHTYQRVICILPFTGQGTWADPKRPMFAPLAAQAGRANSGIIAWYQEPTDSGNAVIAVIVAADRTALQPVLSAVSARVPGLSVFQPGQQNDQQIQAAITAVKKNFDLKRFVMRVP